MGLIAGRDEPIQSRRLRKTVRFVPRCFALMVSTHPTVAPRTTLAVAVRAPLPAAAVPVVTQPVANPDEADPGSAGTYVVDEAQLGETSPRSTAVP